MQKAQQAAMLQQANQLLITIRQSELDYLQTFTNFFATQSVFIAGTLYNSVTNTSGFSDLQSKENWFAKGGYWLTTALGLGFSIRAILIAAFCNVYGYNLSIRGPEGSMTTAVEGMISEAKLIFTCTTVGILFLAFSMNFLCWYNMPINASFGASSILTLMTYQWYSYCLRLYNTFKFDFFMTDEINVSMNPMQEDNPRESSIMMAVRESEEYKKLLVNIEKVKAEGFLMKGSKQSSGMLMSFLNFRSLSVRRYFMLVGKKLYIYGSKNEAQIDGSRLNQRPINIEDCLLKVDDSAFGITLKPSLDSNLKETLELYADSIDEFIPWKSALTEIFKLNETLRNMTGGAGSDGFTVIK